MISPPANCFDFEAHSNHSLLRLRSKASVSLATVLWIRSRYGHPMTGPHLDGVEPLAPAQLGAYFALMEAVSLLQHNVELHIRAEGDLSYVQFQILAGLTQADGQDLE